MQSGQLVSASGYWLARLSVQLERVLDTPSERLVALSVAVVYRCVDKDNNRILRSSHCCICNTDPSYYTVLSVRVSDKQSVRQSVQ